MHELAFAATAAGHRVELRGLVHGPTFRSFVDATSVAPEVAAEPRDPEPDDVVILPEGIVESHAYASVALSGARPILLMLAPPGLFGWPFTAAWELPDPSTVPLESLARPEHFQAARALGFELWTHSRPLAAAAHAAGVPCEWLGTGRPGAVPVANGRMHDIAVVLSNRWAPIAREIAARTRASVLFIEDVDNDAMLAMLSTARVLVWPSRVEGHSRVQCEARLVGAVPVALASNPYAEGLDTDGGAVVVETVDEMPFAIERLLADPGRLATLSQNAMRSSRDQTDWGAYVRRVSMVLADTGVDPARGARGAIGRDAARLYRARLEETARAIQDLGEARNELGAERSRADAAEAREAELRRRLQGRSVRLALRASAVLRAVLRTFRR
ncbi:MAG: glycosyltransferase family 4 protein [Chloroflexi bacterium]|nr:MAG: glycosyltransferase family 4 protein [Chloroflexota bacterium]